MKSNSPLILHIPHSSTLIPPVYRSIYLHPQELDKELLQITDLYTDELFSFDTDTLIFPISRLLCDVERFRDKAQETMTEKGMWICYTHTPSGKRLARFPLGHEKNILSQFYDKHHEKFTAIVAEKLATHHQALIVDGHSFPDSLPYYPPGPIPDICLGRDDFHTPASLLAFCQNYFIQRGYRVAINHPFQGSIVPLTWYGRDRRIKSIMIEVNRNLYCAGDGTKNQYFPRIKRDLHELLASLSTITS